jgi:hypothetical protein
MCSNVFPIECYWDKMCAGAGGNFSIFIGRCLASIPNPFDLLTSR